MHTHGLGACFKHLGAEIVALTYRSFTGFPCKSLDTYEPPGFCQRSPYIFHAVVTPVAFFAAGHRSMFKQELAAPDVAHRKLFRRVAGPPAGMDWSRPWHEILHDWNVQVSVFCGPIRHETLVKNTFGTTLEKLFIMRLSLVGCACKVTIGGEISCYKCTAAWQQHKDCSRSRIGNTESSDQSSGLQIVLLVHHGRGRLGRYPGILVLIWRRIFEVNLTQSLATYPKVGTVF